MGSCMSTNATGGGSTPMPIAKRGEIGIPPLAHVRDGESDDGSPSSHSHNSIEAEGTNSKPVNSSTALPSTASSANTLGSDDSHGEGPSDAEILPSSSQHSTGSVHNSGQTHSDGARNPASADVSVGESCSVGSATASTDRRECRNPKTLGHSSSIIGLDSMIENRREEGGLRTNVVHMEIPFGKPIEEVYEGVHTGPLLGHGISGLVRLVTHKATGVKYAVKCLDLNMVDTDEGLVQLREEIFIMCQLDHPNIVRLEEVYESHSEIYLVQELCLGGELFDRLDEQPDYHYTEAECARLIKQMLCAVRYLHSKGIIHRDLKLENFLFSSTAQDSELKMIDFGLSKHFRQGEVQYEAVGTPYTVAPEVIRGSYDERCDIWAIGVISFLLLSGEPPFGGCGGPEPLLQVRSNILSGEYEFEPEEIWSLVSHRAKQFIQALLVTDPKNRPTARSAQKHKWLLEWADKTRTEDDSVLNPNVVKALVTFKEFSDMRKLLCEVLSFTLLPDQIKDLRKEFEKMDTDGSGEISLSALKQVLVTNAGAGSLGALTEEEVEDIFNAMRVKKTETRIVWHEFIAAGLSQCQVDDRNLRLAFDRLDNDHKGYVTLDDIMDLVGNDALHSEEAMRQMWVDSMEAVNCNQTRITYGDFLMLMKGQTQEKVSRESDIGSTLSLLAVPELNADQSEGNNIDLPPCPDDAVATNMGKKQTPFRRISDPKSPVPQKVLPLSPLLYRSTPEFEIANPLSMDDDDDIDLPNSQYMPPKSPLPKLAPSLNAEMLTTVNESHDMPTVTHQDPLEPTLQLSSLPVIARPPMYVRKRSRSMDDECDGFLKKMNQKLASSSEVQVDSDKVASVPTVMISTECKSGSSNRQLFLAHRQMRNAVLEAAKRFEENQARHARDFLIAEKAKAEGAQAGLVMRRGDKRVSSESVRMLLEQNESQQQKLFDKAHRRCRGERRSRMKTKSDLSGIIISMTQDDFNEITAKAMTAEDTLGPELQDEHTEMTAEVFDSEAKEATIRGATVPGEFRKVQDPFGANGRYRSLAL